MNFLDVCEGRRILDEFCVSFIYKWESECRIPRKSQYGQGSPT